MWTPGWRTVLCGEHVLAENYQNKHMKKRERKREKIYNQEHRVLKIQIKTPNQTL